MFLRSGPGRPIAVLSAVALPRPLEITSLGPEEVYSIEDTSSRHLDAPPWAPETDTWACNCLAMQVSIGPGWSGAGASFLLLIYRFLHSPTKICFRVRTLQKPTLLRRQCPWLRFETAHHPNRVNILPAISPISGQTRSCRPPKHPLTILPPATTILADIKAPLVSMATKAPSAATVQLTTWVRNPKLRDEATLGCWINRKVSEWSY